MREYIPPIVACIFLGLMGQAQCEMFTSTSQLVQLVSTEDIILEGLEDYIKQEEARLNRLRQSLERIQQRHLNGEVPKSSSFLNVRGQTIKLNNDDLNTRRLAYAGHPVNAYNLLKVWSQVHSDLEDGHANNYDDLQNHLLQHSVTLPTSTDLAGAAEAMIRLQETYELNTNDTVQGIIKGVKASQTLDPKDCYEIGKSAISSQQYGFGVQWLEKAVQNLETAGTWFIDALYQLGKTYREVGLLEKAITTLDIAHDKDPQNVTIKAELRRMTSRYERSKEQNVGTNQNGTSYRKWRVDWHLNYQKLCRGEHIDRDPNVVRRLKCVYRKSSIPYAFYKEEIFNFNPRLSVIYNVISNSEIETLKQKARSQLEASRVGDPSKSVQTNERVSKTAWLWDTEPFITHLSERVADITGLHTEYADKFSHAEPFQLVNYGIGGQYEPHFDYYQSAQMLANVPDFIKGTGDRIATFMFYLSDVQAGGATVFPEIFARVPAVKGAAAFWYNVKRSGQCDTDTKHAGCPVLLGEKWVANKWIREFGQLYKRPCGLSEDEGDPS